MKKQNELLEAESTELAHRLVRGQVSRAEEEEQAFAIESELMALRKSHLELSHQLETANEEIRGLSLRLQENVSVIECFNTLSHSSVVVVVIVASSSLNNLYLT